MGAQKCPTGRRFGAASPVRVPGSRPVKAYAISGDFEGVLTVHLGLDDVVGYRVGELPGEPGRIYVDVAA